jgi:hypothetical protein
MPKQDDGPDMTAPAHSFRVTHVMRPGGQLGGGAEVTTGHLNAHEAMQWIRGLVAEHKLGLKDLVHAHWGVHPDVVAQLLPADDSPAVQPTLDDLAAPPAGAAQSAPGGGGEAGGADASAS